MEFRLHVFNCPYSKLSAESALWEYSTMDVYRARFLGNRTLLKKWQGNYRVITNDNIPTTLKLDNNGDWTIMTENGSSKGTWTCEIQRGWSRSRRHRYRVYDRDLSSCNMTFNYGTTMQSRYRCIFEHNGVIILALSKGESILNRNTENYSTCIFLVKEQEGEDRPHTLEQFTSYVRDVYLHHLEDEEVISKSSLPPSYIVRLGIIMAGAFTAFLIVEVALGFTKYLLSISSPLIETILYVLLSCATIEMWIAMSDDVCRNILNHYIRKQREQFADNEIAQTPSLQLFNGRWQGE